MSQGMIILALTLMLGLCQATEQSITSEILGPRKMLLDFIGSGRRHRSPPPPRPPPPAPPTGTLAGWTLLWQDEFDTLSPNNWEMQKYDGCQYGICDWGNNEVEWYTSRDKNVQVQNGKLQITARRDNTTEEQDWLNQDCYDECAARCESEGYVPGDGPQFEWCVGDCGNYRCAQVRSRGITSGRLRSYKKFSIAPSASHSTIRVEASIKLPPGEGLWGAFWMLPEDSTVTWPEGGEIDIMESANDMDTIHGTLHYGGPGSNHTFSGVQTPRVLSNSTAIGPTFQMYAVEWERKQIRWYLDQNHYSTKYSGNGTTSGWFSTRVNATEDAPFDAPFHLILNLAMGGWFTGKNLAACQQTLADGPKTMEVDYVRVYGR